MKQVAIRHRLFFTLNTILLIVLLVFPLPEARAQDVSVSDLAVVNSDSHLLVYLTVRDCFTDEIMTGIHNGIPATFTYYVEIYESRKMWPDKKVFSYSFDRTLSFDNLKELYTVVSTDSGRSTTTEKLADAKQLMAEVTDLRTASLDIFKQDRSYHIKIKAKLEKKTLPWYYQYLFPFSSFWDFETDWKTLVFSITDQPVRTN